MRYRSLGKTRLRVSEIGLGTEWLNKKPREHVRGVIHHAIDHGINYFDVVFAFPEYRDNLGAAFQDHRKELIICGHVCCSIWKSGTYRLSRSVPENKKLFHDLLRRLKTDHVDIVMIQMVNEMTSFENIARSGGIIDLAREFKSAGKARFIGISGHKVPAIRRTLEAGGIDVVMFPVNIAWDMVPGRSAIYDICRRRQCGLVGMKIYGGGRVLKRPGRARVSPVQCISYALSQPGVSTVVPGIRNMRELDQALEYENAGAKRRAYEKILRRSQEELKGNCVYCNHCLPCPANIDIAGVMNALDRKQAAKNYVPIRDRTAYYFPARLRLSRALNFKGLSRKASACTRCGACAKRCPFGVDIIGKMAEAVRILKH